MLLFKKILCPIDFSEPSYKALKAAEELADEFSAELIVVHVLSPAQAFPSASVTLPGEPATNEVFFDDMRDKIESHANESMKMTIEKRISRGINSRGVILNGSPAEEITGYAEDSHVSIIILGTHGFTGWRHILLGSVAEKVVRLSLCPVLTIPAHEEE